MAGVFCLLLVHTETGVNHMTRKDYIALAAALKSAVDNTKTDESKQVFATIYSHIVQALADDNPRFDESRFRRAVFVDL